MAEIEEFQKQELREERTLNLLRESTIDQELSKSHRKRTKRRLMRGMKFPRVIPHVILQFQDESLRENAIRLLSRFLQEKRKDDPDNYYRIGYLLYNSCGTMSILLQEVVVFLRKMADGCLDVRLCRRVVNVLILFQSVAANTETRQKFVDSRVPNFLVPLILFESSLKEFENIRVVALSVIGILCQTREPQITQWAIESNMIEMCRVSLVLGSELAKVIGMHILEALLQDESGISYICSPSCNNLLTGLMKTWEHLTHNLALASDEDLCPRLFFHIIRCFVLLCNHVRGFEVVRDNLPDSVMDDSFHDVREEFPVIGSLLHQLLLAVGKPTDVPDL